MLVLLVLLLVSVREAESPSPELLKFITRSLWEAAAVELASCRRVCVLRRLSRGKKHRRPFNPPMFRTKPLPLRLLFVGTNLPACVGARASRCSAARGAAAAGAAAPNLGVNAWCMTMRGKM